MVPESDGSFCARLALPGDTPQGWLSRGEPWAAPGTRSLPGAQARAQLRGFKPAVRTVKSNDTWSSLMVKQDGHWKHYQLKTPRGIWSGTHLPQKSCFSEWVDRSGLSSHTLWRIYPGGRTWGSIVASQKARGYISSHILKAD